MLICFYQFI